MLKIRSPRCGAQGPRVPERGVERAPLQRRPVGAGDAALDRGLDPDPEVVHVPRARRGHEHPARGGAEGEGGDHQGRGHERRPHSRRCRDGEGGDEQDAGNRRCGQRPAGRKRAGGHGVQDRRPRGGNARDRERAPPIQGLGAHDGSTETAAAASTMIARSAGGGQRPRIRTPAMRGAARRAPRRLSRSPRRGAAGKPTRAARRASRATVTGGAPSTETVRTDGAASSDAPERQTPPARARGRSGNAISTGTPAYATPSAVGPRTSRRHAADSGSRVTGRNPIAVIAPAVRTAASAAAAPFRNGGSCVAPRLRARSAGGTRRCVRDSVRHTT